LQKHFIETFAQYFRNVQSVARARCIARCYRGCCPPVTRPNVFASSLTNYSNEVWVAVMDWLADLGISYLTGTHNYC